MGELLVAVEILLLVERCIQLIHVDGLEYAFLVRVVGGKRVAAYCKAEAFEYRIFAYDH